MIQSIRAIALHSLRYGETSLIAYLYSKEQGRVTLMVNGAYSKGKGGGKVVFFQPLTMLDILYYPGRHGGMGRLKELSPYTTFVTLPYIHVKRTIALFIGEIIYRTIREEESNPSLYQYLENSIQYLDHMEQGIANFHLVFLAHLSKHLGFHPMGLYSEETPFFDIKTGHYVSREPNHPQYLSSEVSSTLSLLLSLRFEEAHLVSLNRNQRNEYLQGIINYYAFHLGSFNNINSLQVLTEVFD